MDTYERERAYFVISTAILLFMLTNFNETLGITYLSFVTLSFLMFITDKNPTINLEKQTNNRAEAFVRGIIYYAIFLFISVLVFQTLKPQLASIQAVLETLAAATPIFANSILLSIVAWGFIIPAAETVWFARFTEWIADRFHIPITRANLPRLILIIIFVSAVFVIFHSTAKGITNNAALILTFVFMFISLLIIIWHGEMKQGVFLHINNNFLSVMIRFGFIK